MDKISEQEAWIAGYDCEMDGANDENCHFSFFATPKLTKSWEEGNQKAKWEKEKIREYNNESTTRNNKS